MRACGILLSGLLILTAGCGKKGSQGPIEERFTVARVDLRDVISQTGEVVPIIKVELKSEASGKIEKIFVKEGQRVSKGQKILEIDPYKLLTKKKQVDLSLQKAAIQKELAERDYRDAQELSATGTVSEKRLKDLKSQLELAEINYRQQQLDMDDIDYQLRQTTVTSPMDGVITELPVEEGEIAVSATSGFQSGTAIATIADISQLEVVTKIGEVDYVHLEVGQKVVVRPEAIENAQTTGVITFIALNAKKPNANELGTFDVRIGIDSLIPGLAPGINVNVEFVVLDKKGVLGIPCHYVKKEGNQASVLVALAPGAEIPPEPKAARPEMAEGRRGRPGAGAELSDEERQKRREEWQNKRAATEKKETAPKSGKKGETIIRRQIKIGATDYKHYEVREGLREGQVVVFQPESLTNDKKNTGRAGGGGLTGGRRR